MKMKLTLVSLLFLGIGVLARSPTLTSAEANVAANELSERYTRSASSESAEVETGGSTTQYAMQYLKYLTSILGLKRISKLRDLVMNYYSGSLPLSIEALLKTLGITISLQNMHDPSGLYQLMNSIPIVGIIVNFMTNTLFIPISIIAFVYSLITTVMGHMHNALPSILSKNNM